MKGIADPGKKGLRELGSREEGIKARGVRKRVIKGRGDQWNRVKRESRE